MQLALRRGGAGAALLHRNRPAAYLGSLADTFPTLAALPRFVSKGAIRFAAELGVARDWIARLKIKTPSPDTMVGSLSGGNQQKVVLAKWLAMKPKVLLLDEPTRGIDVGAKAEIYDLVHRLAGGTTFNTALEHEEVLTAVVAWLLKRRIRLPAQSEKMLYLIGGSLFIMITMNFRKSLRTIVERTADAA
jgi:ABC-type sugar transport system ATPase subunit